MLLKAILNARFYNVSVGCFSVIEDDAFRIIFDMFGAGTETTSTTLQWLFIYLMFNQTVQDKCRKEIYEVMINSSSHGQNGGHFADDVFLCIFVNEKFCILIKNLPEVCF